MVSKLEDQKQSSDTETASNVDKTSPSKPISRRKSILYFAGLTTAAATFLNKIFHNPAYAATWQYLDEKTSVGGGNTWRSVNLVVVKQYSTLAGGRDHSVALRSDGLVFACGYNVYGQLGNNSVLNKSSYVQAVGVSNMSALAAGWFHSLALRSDGLVFACGNNLKGELGINSTVNKSTYVQTVGISNVVALAGGYHLNLALRIDGLVFACGYNLYGQLGDNSIVYKSTYVQALAP